MSAKKKKGPNFVAKKGNVEIPIYTIKQGCPNQQHVVCYHEGGKRKRRAFSDLDKAKAEANIIAKKLNKGELEAIRLTGLFDRVAEAFETLLSAENDPALTGLKPPVSKKGQSLGLPNGWLSLN